MLGDGGDLATIETDGGRMLRRVVYLVGALVLSVVTFLTLVVVGMRTKSPRVLRFVRRMNRAVSNPIQMRSAGHPGANASIIRHRGRTSGQPYETPVEAETTDDGFIIAMPYGTTTDWLKNLLAAGTATIVHEGETFEVDQPEVRPLASEIAWFPAADQRTLHRFRVEHCVRVRRVDRSGTT
jgi:deazaflavin-dependent oxidoreductase (nitroreductase family)